MPRGDKGEPGNDRNLEEVYMETNLIAILITLAIAALASPVTAQSASAPHKADGSIARTTASPVAEGSEIRLTK